MMNRLIVVAAAALALGICQLQAAPPPDPGKMVTDIEDGFVELYAGKNFEGARLVVKGKTDIPNLEKVSSDDGKKKLEGKVSSAKHQIPEGWKAVLYAEKNYKGPSYVLRGTGRIDEAPDLAKLNNKASSVRWERD